MGHPPFAGKGQVNLDSIHKNKLERSILVHSKNFLQR